MIEKTVMDFLKANLDIPVLMETPEEPVSEYVLVEKTGSGKENYIYTASLAVQSVSDSLYHAAALNEKVKRAMEHLADLPDVCRADLNSDYNYTDTAAKSYRYQAVFDVTHY